MEEMCGGGFAFPCECGATPYGPKHRERELPLRKELQEALFLEAGTGSTQHWGKRAFFGEEEAATWHVFVSLYLQGIGLLIKLKTSRSAQRTEVPETGPCISPSL